jgi:hypothetical protein
MSYFVCCYFIQIKVGNLTFWITILCLVLLFSVHPKHFKIRYSPVTSPPLKIVISNYIQPFDILWDAATGRARAQALNRRPSTEEAWFRDQVNPCGIFGGQLHWSRFISERIAYIYVHMHTHTHIYIYIHIHTYIHIHIHIHTFIHTYIITHTELKDTKSFPCLQNTYIRYLYQLSFVPCIDFRSIL